jgi:uncharacterized membrane protein
MPNAEHFSEEHQMEQTLGNLLRAGVLLAAAVVLAGGVVYLVRHGREEADPHGLRDQPEDLRHPTGIVAAVLEGRGRGLIQLGLLLLIATPVARVAFSVFGFLRQRDYLYVAVTLFVLAVLLYSLLSRDFASA